MTITAKLHKLASLPNGWRYGTGIPPQEVAINTAQEIYRHLVDLKLQADVFPGEDGSLSLVFYKEEKCVETNISRYGTINIDVEDGEGFDYEVIKTVENASINEVAEQVILLATGGFDDKRGN